MIRRFVILLTVIYTLTPDDTAARLPEQVFRVMFYNVENLFDTYDDPLTEDDEFLTDGPRHWTPKRYYGHLRRVAQVVNAVGEWDTPALIGLCEVENDSVLTHLIYRTQLRAQNYRYCLSHGNDPRGINTALLYQRDKFKYMDSRSVRIHFRDKDKRSRDILHVWGEVITGDTLDVFVCHFPSRSGGEMETEQARIDAATCLRHLCDSLHQMRHSPNILVMGDFNDYPSDRSIQIILNEQQPERKLKNLFADPKTLNFMGSHKYQGEWSQLDQMMISASWERYLKKSSVKIFDAPFLFREDKTHRGQRPWRIYYGFKYEGGFSDHLPIVADFLLPLPDE